MVGTLAAVLTPAAWLPQLLRAWRERSAGDLSWLYLGTMTAGLTSWLVYGTRRHDLALLGANAVSLVLVLSLSAVKVVTDRRRP